LRDLARGPGRLAAALRIDRSHDGLDLCREGPLCLGCGDYDPGEIGRSIRIGISRFNRRNSPFVSPRQTAQRERNWRPRLGRQS
jgi:DNA-3-methyladenine glycosylase